MSAIEPTRLTARDAMHPGVITCPPTATLRTVGRILAAHRIHAVVVASEEEPAPIRRLNPAIPVDLATIATKCLAKDPAGRYETAWLLAAQAVRQLKFGPSAPKCVAT